MKLRQKKDLLTKSNMQLRLFKAVFQEIMVEHFRDFHQLGHVDALSFEHLINIRLLTINTFGKPIDCTALSCQFLLDEVADVHIFHFKFHNSTAFEKLCKCKMMEKKLENGKNKVNQNLSKYYYINKWLSVF